MLFSTVKILRGNGPAVTIIITPSGTEVEIDTRMSTAGGIGRSVVDRNARSHAGISALQHHYIDMADYIRNALPLP